MPALPFLAIAQHLLGVFDVFLVGLLVFGWFRFWRWLIVPATLLLAVNPVLLWYEHTALAETWAVTGVLLVALAGTAFARMPCRYTFAMLLGATLFMAGARPEGRLFALFALALVIRVLWGNLRALRVAAPVMLVWTSALFALTRTSQSGLLLLTSVLHLSPERLTFSPGVAEALAPLAAEARAEWTGPDAPKLVPLRKAISDRIIDFQAGVPPAPGREARERHLRARRSRDRGAQPTPLPALAVEKFVIAHRELPGGDFDAYPLAGQIDALYGNGEEQKNVRYARLLWGRAFDDEADARAFLQNTYRPMPTLTRWLENWVAAGIAPVAPWSLPGRDLEKCRACRGFTRRRCSEWSRLPRGIVRLASTSSGRVPDRAVAAHHGHGEYPRAFPSAVRAALDALRACSSRQRAHSRARWLPRRHLAA